MHQLDEELIKKEAFQSPYEQYVHRNGEKFEIIGEVSREMTDYDEVGPLWHIKFPDGQQIHAWPEEIFENQLVGE
jgi:hypothetical protein